VLEYLTAEIFETAGEIAKASKKVRITPRHINLAVCKDEEMNKLLNNVTFPSAGVLPHIENVLLPPRSDEEKSQRATTVTNKAGSSRAEGKSAGTSGKQTKTKRKV
jgi:hypothetical protein